MDGIKQNERFIFPKTSAVQQWHLIYGLNLKIKKAGDIRRDWRRQIPALKWFNWSKFPSSLTKKEINDMDIHIREREQRALNTYVFIASL